MGHWPALTNLTLRVQDLAEPTGHCRRNHWPLLEAKPFVLPSLIELNIFVQYDVTGLLQLEHIILGLKLKTSALWHKRRDAFHTFERIDTYRDFKATRCFTS